MDKLPPHDGSFVVRIWWEHGEQSLEAESWRGWVQHVRNGKHLYFRSLAALCAFIAEETGTDTKGEPPSEGLG